MAGYNRTRYVEELLEKTESQPPSLTIHLHPDHWSLNNGSKFLYHNQIASLLDDIRAHRIPVDFLELFDAAHVPFYDGCMVVELLDYRPQRNKEPTPEKPEKTRVILHPNSETLWADICSLSQRHGGKWTDDEALQIEAKLLLATSPPLCLDPDPHLTRIANHVLRVSTPTVPVSLKRKAAALETEEDETDKARRAKIMAFMNPRAVRSHAPNYKLLDAIHSVRQSKAGEPQKPAAPLPGHPYISKAQPPPTAAPTPVAAQQILQTQPITELADKKVQQIKADTPQMSFVNTAFTRANGSHTPVPPQPTHQFVNQHPTTHHQTPSPSTNSPMQPQVYASVQAATEAAKRVPTPAQQQQQQHQLQQLQKQQQLLQQQRQPSPPKQSRQQPQHQQQQPQQSQHIFSNSPKPTAQAPTVAQSQNLTPIQPHATSIPSFPSSVPFLQTPKVRNATGKPTATATNTQPQTQQVPNAQHIAHVQAQNQAQNAQMNLYAQQIAHSQQQLQQQVTLLAQQRRNTTQKNGRATPQTATSQNTPSPARNSPITANQNLAARSPMPPHAQQLPQMMHPQQHPHHIAFTPQYTAAHLRSMAHANSSPHTQSVSSPLATNASASSPSAPSPAPAGGAAENQNQTQPQHPTQGQPQPQQIHSHPAPQHHPYAQIYGYPQMNFQMSPGRMAPTYWQMGMGRGMPSMVNGQTVPGMPANAQQIALGMGKQAVPGGMPGR